MIRFQRLYIHRMGVNIFYNYAWVIEFWSDLLIKSNIYRVLSLWYLDLTSTPIKRLFESVCSLYNLPTLKLYYCGSLVELPTAMCKLIRLHHLDISHSGVKEMPSQWVTFNKNWVTMERGSKVRQGLESLQVVPEW